MTQLPLTGPGFADHHLPEHVLATASWDEIATGSLRHRGTIDRIAQVLAGGPFDDELAPSILTVPAVAAL